MITLNFNIHKLLLPLHKLHKILSIYIRYKYEQSLGDLRKSTEKFEKICLFMNTSFEFKARTKTCPNGYINMRD